MSAARTSTGSLASDSSNARAVPTNSAGTLDGIPISGSAGRMASTAAPSDEPGATLYEIVTDGNWPWWFTTRGNSFGSIRTNVESGTGAPESDRTYILPSAAG